MSGTAVEEYLDAFRDRVATMRRPGQELRDEPGLLALLGLGVDTLDGRVVVSSDAAYDVLEARRHELFARVVLVFDDAPRACRLMSRQAGYRSDRATAMVCPDLAARALEARMPPGLTVRPVQVDPAEADPPAVPLRAAADAALRSDPTAAPASDLDGFVAYLRSVPAARFLAAVDGGGTVRATAAAAIWRRTSGVFFVNTDPAWRGRGVASAMTAAVLRSATEAGAERALLDASALGRALSLRLGFEAVAELTMFVASPG